MKMWGGSQRWWWAGVVAAVGYAIVWNESSRLELVQENAKLQKEVESLRERFGVREENAAPSTSLQVEEETWPVALLLHMLVFATVTAGLVHFVKSELEIAKVSCYGQEADKVHEEVYANAGYQDHVRKAITQSLNFSLKEFAFYRMDYVLSNWASAKPVALLIATYLLIMIGSVFYYIASEGQVTLSEAVWVSWTFVADPGTHAEETSSATRGVALFLTMGGMLIFALMIGIIADGVSDLLDDLKKGKSRVIETGHTLILGWSDKVIPTIREIAIANESEGGGTIVVLAERPKEEMESDLSSALTPELLMGTEVVCRAGSPLIMTDLLKVSAQTAKAVIVLSDPTVDPDESDARVVRIVMSLTGIHIRSHIVAEMCDVDNRELVLLVGKGKVETVVAHDIIGRLMIQCARQPGLAQILEQLLGFDGDEFYLAEWSSLEGKTFLDACFSFDQAIPVGVKPANPEEAAQQIRNLEAHENFRSLSPAFSSHSSQDVSPVRKQRTSSNHKKGGVDRDVDIDKESRGGKEVAGEGEEEEEDTDSAVSGISSSQSQDSPRRTGKAWPVRQRTGSLTSALGSGPPTILLNPPDGYVIQPGDEILVIAEDDDSYEPSEGETPSEAALVAKRSVTRQHSMPLERGPERLLFCGWRRDLDDMIASLDRLVTKGSELHLMCTIPVKTRLKKFRDANKLDLNSLQNLHIIHEEGNPVLRRHLEGLELESFSSILILADEAFETNMQTADSRSLASLLLIRDIIQKRNEFKLTSLDVDSEHRLPSLPDTWVNDHQSPSPGSRSNATSSDDDELSSIIRDIQSGRPPSPRKSRKDKTSEQKRERIHRSWCPRSHKVVAEERETTIISEILDSRTKSLISVAQVSDYVMSNEIVACAMAMVAEDRAINTVLTELLSASGSEIQVASCLDYCSDGEELDFWTMMARARKRFEVAIGYKARDDETTTINPRDKAEMRVWRKGDILVVLTLGAG